MLASCRRLRILPCVATLLLLFCVGLTDAVGQQAGEASQTEFLGPIDVAVSADGGTLYVANADARRIDVVETASTKVLRSITVPAEPTGLVLSGDGATLYVTCAAPQGSVCPVDVASGEVGKPIAVGHGARGPAISPDDKTLYVCNRFDNNVAIVELPTRQVALVPTTREPYAAVVTPDGQSVFVINHLPADRADTYDVAAVVTVIDAATRKTQTIRLHNGATGVRGISVSPDGGYVYVTHILSRYQMPTTQVERGWINTNALAVVDARQKKLLNTVLLDDIDRGAANPWGVACTADGKTICVAYAGTHELGILDAEPLLEKLLAMPKERVREEDGKIVGTGRTAADVPNDLAFLNGLRRRIVLGGGTFTLNGPRGLAVAGTKAFVAAYFTDNVAVVELESNESDPVATIALGPAPKLSAERRGEMLFNDATLCHQHWQSCASCHPDARADALNRDLIIDGLGNPKNGRSMVLGCETPPSMAAGVVPTAEAAVRSAMTHLLFARDFEQNAMAIDAYLKSIKPLPSPHLVEGRLSPAAERGRQLFFDATVNCARCHPEPLFTDMELHDVGSRGQYDRRDTFDTPTLVECWRTAPYLHDGKYTTVKQLLTEGKHGDENGSVEKLSERQIDDLVEYVLSL